METVAGTTSGASVWRRIRARVAVSRAAIRRAVIGKPSAHRDNIGTDQVDHHGKLARKQIKPKRDGRANASLPGGDDGRGSGVLPGQMLVQAFQPARAADGVEAADLAATAGKGRVADHRAVAPFARIAPWTRDKLTVQDKAAPDPGAQDNAEDVAIAFARARGGLGQCKTIGIVEDQDGKIERGF